MNGPYMDTPDLCTSGLVYVAAGLLVRIHSGRATPRIFILFGVILGIAYFSKTVMFLVAFAFLVAAGRRRETGLAFASFVAVTFGFADFSGCEIFCNSPAEDLACLRRGPWDRTYRALGASDTPSPQIPFLVLRVKTAGSSQDENRSEVGTPMTSGRVPQTAPWSCSSRTATSKSSPLDG
jgi:hypothetical protein